MSDLTITDLAARDMRIADLERDLAAKSESLTTANAALNRICEILCAPAPVCPADAVEAVARQLGDDNDTNNRAKTAEQALKDINLALLDVGAPRTYTLDDKSERPIPDPERIRILGDRLRAEWREIADAHLALDDAGAPRLADGTPLSTAARVRALKT